MAEADAARPRPELAEQVRAAAEAVQAHCGLRPRVGLVLGSGLGELADEIESPAVLPYASIPHVPVPSAPGHAGQLVLGMLQGVPVAALRGRVHFYEGHSLQQVTLPIRVLRRLGAEIVVLTNAAGGLNERFAAGDLMAVTDHLNLPGLAGHSPLIGPEQPALGQRFVDLLGAYDAELLRLAQTVATERGLRLHQGVYAMVAGPSYETAAETRFLRGIGADAVGMSTVPEVLVARQEGLRVLAISAITNAASGATETSHQAVLAAANTIKPRLLHLLRGLLAALAPATS